MDGHAYFDDPHMAELAEALKFTSEDLAYNREGMLSPAQIVTLRNDHRLSFWLLALDVTALAFILGLSGLVYAESRYGPLILLLPTGVLLTITLVKANGLNNRLLDVPWYPVSQLILCPSREGLDQLFKKRQRRFSPGNKNIAGFIGNRKLYRALKANKQYYIYYTPAHHPWIIVGTRILSIEPVADRPVITIVPDKLKQKPKTKRSA